MHDWRRVGSLVVLTLVAWGVALSTGRRLPYQLAYVLTGLLVGAWAIAWLNVRGWVLERHVSTRRASVGDWLEEHFLLRNRLWLPRLWLEVRDESTLPGHRASQVIPGVGPRGRYPWHVRTRLLARGIFRLGPTLLRSSDPFGLFSFAKRLPEARELIVYPYTAPLTLFPLPQGRFSGGEFLRERSLHVTTTVASVREYQPGDPFNRIHWPTTARTGRLMSKEFEADPLADIWLVLDLHADVYTGAFWEPEDFHRADTLFLDFGRWANPLPPHAAEYAVAAAASIARYALQRDRMLGLITYGPDQLLIQPDRGERQLHRVLEALAGVSLTYRMSVEQVLTAMFGIFQRNTTLVLVTGNWTTRWIPPLLELRRRSVWPVVVLVDSATFGPLPSVRAVLPILAEHAIPTFVMEKETPLEDALQRPVVSG